MQKHMLNHHMQKFEVHMELVQPINATDYGMKTSFCNEEEYSVQKYPDLPSPPSPQHLRRAITIISGLLPKHPDSSDDSDTPPYDYDETNDSDLTQVLFPSTENLSDNVWSAHIVEIKKMSPQAMYYHCGEPSYTNLTFV